MAKYRVGVIGCRGIGVRHTSGLVGLPNAELVAACDILENYTCRLQGAVARPLVRYRTLHGPPRDVGKGELRHCDSGNI